MVTCRRFDTGHEMRAVIQRVDRAGVRVDDKLVSDIGKGVLVFLGVETGDGAADADYLLEKIINLRIFEDDQGKMNLSLLDLQGDMLVVSQFTLLADCSKGRRPSFAHAEVPEKARNLYEYFLEKGKEKLDKVFGGIFQAMMKIDIVNDGPVTIMLDTKREL